MKKSFMDADVELSSRAIPCFDGVKRKVSWFQDGTGRVWLSAEDMGMDGVGKPNTCGNCIQWRSCSKKNRDECPDIGLGSEFDPTVTKEQRMEALLEGCKHSRDQIQKCIGE